MHIFEIISEDAIYNIIGHIKNCWNYTYPTGAALEEAIYRGLHPFYPNTRALGGPNTIVDVAKDQDAFDIKGAKKLGFLSRLGSNSNLEENNFIEEDLPNGKKIIVKIPKDILAIVKRPDIDMERFEGNPIEILNKSIHEYKDFAELTKNRADCKNLYSIVVLYEEDIEKGYRSIFLTLEDFKVPVLSTGSYILSDEGKNTGYIGNDPLESVCYKILKFNNGSVNSYKKFECSRGILYTWIIDEGDVFVFDKTHVNKHGSIRLI